jgi:hypothetical protein
LACTLAPRASVSCTLEVTEVKDMAKGDWEMSALLPVASQVGGLAAARPGWIRVAGERVERGRRE